MGIAKAGPGAMKSYRRDRAGKERAAQRSMLKKAATDDNTAAELSHEQAPWNEWDSPRDGKVYYDEKRFRSKGWDRK